MIVGILKEWILCFSRDEEFSGLPKKLNNATVRPFFGALYPSKFFFHDVQFSKNLITPVILLKK